MKTLFVRGSEIYKAAIAGAKRGYNRSTSDYSAYEKLFEVCYRYHLSKIKSPHVRIRVWRATCGNWRRADLPVQFLMVHKHIGGVDSEPHARIALCFGDKEIIDVPMENWKELIKKGLVVN